jgi:hypothetical protein
MKFKYYMERFDLWITDDKLSNLEEYLMPLSTIFQLSW